MSTCARCKKKTKDQHRAMKITAEFSRQDDCLERMVPSDLRQLVNERDAALAEVERLRREVSRSNYQEMVLSAGFKYWRAPDAHGVKGTKEQAEEFIAGLIGVEVKILPSPGTHWDDAIPLSEWEEDLGSVLWWRFPVDEPPYCGTPNDSDWPGYHTHWTVIAVPDQPLVDLSDPPLSDSKEDDTP